MHRRFETKEYQYNYFNDPNSSQETSLLKKSVSKWGAATKIVNPKRKLNQQKT